MISLLLQHRPKTGDARPPLTEWVDVPVSMCDDLAEAELLWPAGKPLAFRVGDRELHGVVLCISWGFVG